MGVVPGQSIWRQDDHRIEFTTPHRITQPVQCRPIQPGAADPLIDIFVLWQQGPPVVLNVTLECASLTRDGPFVLLLIGRDARIVGYLHLGPPDVPE
jgi:hypothetical protein